MPARKHKVITVSKDGLSKPVSSLLINRIRPQVNFDACEEAGLMYSVFERALLDFCEYFHRWENGKLSNRVNSHGVISSDVFRTSVSYLNGEMIHLQLIGINPDWVRSTMKVFGFDVQAVHQELINE